MRVEWRLHVLGERLKRDLRDSPDLIVTDLYGVTPREQSAAIDAMIETQGDFPITVVNGVVTCVNDIDTDAIAAEVGRSFGK